ncbi:hypothetical protein B0H21DRAFT_818806 [Amylocystis lapponica]|nr:hypothetical protein B0H21DRAFT_818806 [Amylocystis lapponica]
MLSTKTALFHQLEELHLLKCSLLPGESLVFDPHFEDGGLWGDLLEQYSYDPEECLSHAPDSFTPAQFQVRIEHAKMCLEVFLPPSHKSGVASGATTGTDPVVSVKGQDLNRSEQERWQLIVSERLNELRDSDYPVYELLSTHLLPRLHAEFDTPAPPSSTLSDQPEPPDAQPGMQYHALLSSHHFVAPSKRRALSQWAGALALYGFAKLGHPGIIYCVGAREAVEEFVRRVRALQWLALRLRFIEPLSSGDTRQEGARWVEFEKVGEVVQEMRRLGREHFVVEMGIGSAGNSS